MAIGNGPADPARLKALADQAILDTAPEREFDDLVLLAARLCGAPTALISLVTDDRQWFKARVGIAAGQTGLESSICAHVLTNDGLLVIPDLEADPRTVANPLVADAEGFRFYAGAPLKVADGHVLGALCVLDREPRPDGLTLVQTEGLGALARQAVRNLELRRIARRAAPPAITAPLADSDWQRLFETMADGFVVAQVIRDSDGRVVDWRYVYANPAIADLMGMPIETVVGRTVREVMPDIEAFWVATAAEVVDTGRLVDFVRPVRQLRRWYDGRAMPLDGDRLSITVRDVTDRVEGYRRRDALFQIVDALRQMDDIGAMTSAAARIVGETMEVTRAGFGRMDGDARTVDIERDWTAPGVASIAGHYRFEDFGHIRDELAKGEPLVIDDVATDPRTAYDPAPMRAVGIGALVNMPICQRGRPIAMFLVHDDKPRHWTDRELDFLRNIADRVEAAVMRVEAAAQQRVLTEELSHRLKNTLMMVQAIATQSLRRIDDQSALQAFEGRLHALAAAHDVLLQRNWTEADIAAVIRRVLRALAEPERVSVAGPPVALGSRAVLTTSMLVHELATNATKYGALSADEGRVAVSWTVEDGMLTLTWAEAGGPPVVRSAAKGLGSRLIAAGLLGAGGARIEYAPEGMGVTLRASVKELGAA